jgi:CHC2 zinc finger
MSVPAEAIEIAHEADLLNLAQIYGVVLKRAGANEFAGGCPTCGGVDRFSINVKKRVWNCRQCSLGGDPIALVMHVEGCSFAEAVERLTGGAWRPSERKRPIPTSDSGGPAREISKARQRWSEGVDPRGTIVEKYLLGRGLELSDDIASEVVRLHRDCPWKSDDGSLVYVPVMLAVMRSIKTDEIMAVSRRRLTPEGAKVGKPRFLGVASGAAIKLDADTPLLSGLCICEGAETGIAGRMLGLKPMWCLGSKDAIKAFPILGGVDCLTILAEPDAEAAVEQCARRWYEAGREVIINRSRIGKDLADALGGGDRS